MSDDGAAAVDAEARELARELEAAGYKVTTDLCVTADVAARLIQRRLRTLRAWRYDLNGPRWERDGSGTVWYSLKAIIEWRRTRPAPEIGFDLTQRPSRNRVPVA